MLTNKYPKLTFVAAFMVAFVILAFIKNAFFDTLGDDKRHFSDYSRYLGAEAIAVYYSPSCSVCTHLKAYLAANNVAYSAKNIDASPVFSREFDQLDFNTVPLILTKDYAIIGFHKDEVDKAIHLYRKQ